MPSDFDWIFKRDPFWRERPTDGALAVRRSHPNDALHRRVLRLRRYLHCRVCSRACARCEQACTDLLAEIG